MRRDNPTDDEDVLGKAEKHPSYGLIAFDRAHFGDFDRTDHRRVFFGSGLKHDSFIRVTIHRAELRRRLDGDDVYPDGPSIVEVIMSPTQFAEAITSLDQGEGTPCTIVSVSGKEVPELPFKSKRVQFDEEFGASMEKIVSKTGPFVTEIKRLLAKPNLGKNDRKEIEGQLRLLVREISSTLPFIKEQFTEQMDKTVLEAKNDFDAYVQGRLKNLGLTGLKKELLEARDQGIAALEGEDDAGEKGEQSGIRE